MLSDESIKKFQEIYKKEFGKEVSRAEACEMGCNLVNLVKVLCDAQAEDLGRQAKLKDQPDGFHLEGGTYSCGICQNPISGEQTWYDKCGINCIPCRDARRKRIIPNLTYEKRGSWYAIWEFDYYWNVKSTTVRKFIRNGKLKARVIPESRFHVILIKDNKGFLPEKPKSHLVKTPDNYTHVEYEKVKSPFDE